ncbi:MAG: hypothetical protein ACK4RW_12195 [Rehaibacterium terrae]|uniref:hypothetical protein n=1 Tax=Rehaibacterium terrae TaxID=1341696 RepID=UPI003918BCB1
MSRLPDDLAARLRFLARVVDRECKHLSQTDARLFAEPFTAQRASALDDDPTQAERVEAFVSRFARLQDTLGDKLLTSLLRAIGETPGAAIDNLDRAERLGWLPSADEWLAARQLRNRMVHEYVEDPAVLADALQTGHTLVPMLLQAAERMLGELRGRSWL